MSEILMEVTRGPLAENLLRGHLAVLGENGRLQAFCGDPDYVSYLRSAAKPLQASAAVEAGVIAHYGISQEELAVMCGSHLGEDVHVRAVTSILHKIGLTEADLTLGPELSLSKDLREQRLADHLPPRKIYNNCSGKHSCMLALCQYYGYDYGAYQRLEHPVQQLILQTLAAYADYPAERIIIGVDGCGVPVFALPLRQMALAYYRLCNPENLPPARAGAARLITAAMARHPEMVAGTGRFCTELMRATQGRIIGKLGADGVYCCAPQGGKTAIALKMEDGSGQALAPVMVSALTQLGLLTAGEQQALKAFAAIDNYNCQGERVGQWRPVFTLRQA